MGGVIALLPLYAVTASTGKAEFRAFVFVETSILGLGITQHHSQWISDCIYQTGKHPGL
jgi:hypothetical protein